MATDISTKAKVTWCPGCPNSQILVAFREAVSQLIGEGKLKLENMVAAAGIGCHGEIGDYLAMNTFISLHGRLIPTMTGIKVANRNLKVVGFSGDGDSLDEGIEHLVHAARRNSDISLFLHNNQVFALTTGQATPTSPKGFKGKSTPDGNKEEPFNPLLLILSAGATFVARTYAGDIAGTQKIMRMAMEHKGFAFTEIIQPCITFFDTRDYFKDRIYWMPDDAKKDDLKMAMEKVMEAEKVPLGVFYDIEKPTFEEGFK